MVIDSFGSALDRVFRRYMPDPFVLAIGLTFTVLVLGVVVGDAYAPGATAGGRVVDTLLAWQSYLFEPRRADGSIIEGYVYFAFQMCMVLVTGHALATSPPVERFVGAIARSPRTAGQATALVAFVACAAALIHWGLGLVVGALMAREVGRQAARRKLPVHYPLLGAAGYTGLMVWGGGLSGSIPLKAAEYVPPEALAARYPLDGGIPLALTLWSPLNVAVAVSVLIVVPLVSAALVPADESARAPFPDPLHGSEGAPEDVDEGGSRFVQRVETSRLLAGVVAAMGLGVVGVQALRGEFALTINSLNVMFLFGGILLQGSLVRYARAIEGGVRGCAGILLQFPFYFGVLGILLASGLAGQVARGIASASTELTYPILVFLSAGLVNLFVPSGGGQWIVQGDIVISGALDYADLLGKSVLALAYGDGWTNMLQPFWALPLLAITGLRARDIIGYTATLMLVAGVVIVAWLAIL
jgi:short-chain fatty acids transporter